MIDIGIEDPWVKSAYLLCVASALLCVLYGLVTWFLRDEPVEEEDIQWAREEEKVEGDL